MGTNYWYYNHLFENKIIQLSRQSFEDFFTQIMKAKDGNFMKVKAYGRDGDGACDGYNRATGDFYLIYAPDELTKDTTQSNAISKIKNDIDGIIKQWNNIKTINYVINDKFLGLGPKVHKLIIELQKDKARELLRKFIFNSEAFSFRQCINRFLRQGKRSYVKYFTSVPGEKESSTAVVLLYLLGLNFELAQNKIELKKHLDG